MATISMRQMLEAGVHFGHQTRYWNPKMAPYIFGARSKIYIINLEKPCRCIYLEALDFIGRLASGWQILLVGTKRSAREATAEAALRCGMPYVNHRWLGGMLTNFKTVRQSIQATLDLELMAQDGTFERRPRKGHRFAAGYGQAGTQPGWHQGHGQLADAVRNRRRSRKHRRAGGQQTGNPGDRGWSTATPARWYQPYHPGNDDAIRAIQLYVGGLAEAVLESRAVLTSAASRKSSSKSRRRGAAGGRWCLIPADLPSIPGFVGKARAPDAREPFNEFGSVRFQIECGKFIVARYVSIGGNYGDAGYGTARTHGFGNDGMQESPAGDARRYRGGGRSDAQRPARPRLTRSQSGGAEGLIVIRQTADAAAMVEVNCGNRFRHQE